MVVCRQEKHPLRLAFRAREGCVDREPLCLAIQAREGFVVVCRKKKHPLHLVFRAREGWRGCVDKKKHPSISRFERGRWRVVCQKKKHPLRLAREGWRVCQQRNTPSVSCFKQGRGGGCVDKRKHPSVSRFERGRGEGCVDRKPLRLAIQVREGFVVACRKRNTPSVSRFERGREQREWVGSVVISKLN